MEWSNRIQDDQHDQDSFLFFQKVLLDSGWNEEPANIFRSRLSKNIEVLNESEKHKFERELNGYMENSSRFFESLEIVNTNNSESLVRTLLNTSKIQSHFLSWILDKMAEMALSQEDENINRIISLILSEIRLLDFIEDSDSLTDKCLDIIEASSTNLQIDLISSLPEIISDTSHSKLAIRLRDLLSVTPSLTNVILDTLPLLVLESNVLTDVLEGVLKTVYSAQFEHLPVIVKFVLLSASSNPVEIISQLRNELDLTPPSVFPSQTQENKQKDLIAFQNTETLIMDAIRISMIGTKAIGDAWFHILDSVVKTNPSPIDIAVLLHLFDLPNRQKSVENLFKNKIRSGIFDEDYMKKTFSGHSTIIRPHFESLISLLEPCICSEEPLLNYFSSVVYREAFLHLGKYYQQELVADLVTKISSGVGTFRDVSISNLYYLSANHTQSMLPYALFVTSILDFVSNMNLIHVRRIMDILSLLAYAPNSSSQIRSELHIVLKKQLYSPNIKYKQMGVLGSVVMIKSMRQFDEDHFEEARKLLEMVQEATNDSGEICGLFMDELSNVLMTSGRSDNTLEAWIAESLTNDFQEEFIVDITPNLIPDDDFMKYEILFNLEEDEDKESHGDEDGSEAIALNLGPMVIRNCNYYGKENKHKINQISRLIPHFRLLRLCVSIQNNGDLNNVDALLGCPIMFPQNDKIDLMEYRERNAYISSLFYLINWFRELLNAFSKSEDSEYVQKTLLRLKNILELEGSLQKCLCYANNYVPPSVLHLADISDWTSVKVSKKKKGGKSKKRKLDSEDLEEKDKSDFVCLKNYSPFFRELDMDVFQIMKIDTIKIGPTYEDPCFRPSDLLFLLKDLQSKCEHVLLSSVSAKKGFPGKGNWKKAGFANLDNYSPNFVATFAVDLMDYILGNLEVCVDHFDKLKQLCEDDSMMVLDKYDDDDNNNNDSILNEIMEKCYSLLNRIIGWNGFKSKDQRSLYKEALSKLASRTNPKYNSKSSTIDLINGSTDYIIKFSKSIISSQLQIASSLVKLLVTIKSGDESCDSISSIVELSKDFLRRKWKEIPNGSVESLLNIYLVHSSSFSAIDEYSKEMNRLELEGGSSYFGTLVKGNMGLHYKILFSSCVSLLKDLKGDLKYWSIASLSLSGLVSVVKGTNSRILLLFLLKYSRYFLDAFNKRCMPIIDEVFRRQKEDCVSLLRSMQSSTRFLQYVCTHSKIHKDVTLSNHVPLLKKYLETFVYRVKSALALNNCLKGFWLGNLKNRDLRGEEILSQIQEDEDVKLADEEEEDDTEDKEKNEENDSWTQNDFHSSFVV